MSDTVNTTDSHVGSGSVLVNIEGAKNVQTDIHTQAITNSNVYFIQGQGLNEPEIEGLRTSPIGNSTPTDTSHLVLKEKLKQLYEIITLPTVAWLEEGSDLSMDEYFVKLHLNQSNVSIEVSEIFNPANSQKPLRILMEGQPGFGKTTLACKLAYDWAKNEEYMNHFKLVLFMSLRELHGRSIEKQIEEISNYCGYQKDDIVEIVNSNESDVLFILDGLDEVNSQDRQEIIKLLYGKTYKDATVVVTCRTGLFKFSNEDRIRSFGLSNVNPNFVDKHVSILGIESVEEKRKFLNKYMPEQMVENIIKNLSSQLELFDSPLFLIFLPVIIEENEDLTQFSTRTHFFKKLFNACIKHSYSKRQKQIDFSFDLFCLNGRINEIQEQIQDFGILSMQKILNSEFKFECDDLTKQIYEFGLLINHQEKKRFTSKNHYEGLHLSLLEFASAFAVFVDLTLNTFAVPENLLQEMVHHFLDSEGTSLVLPFLAGLMQENVNHLLSKIQSFSAWFLLEFKLTGILISECLAQNIHMSKCLIDFIPSRIYNYWGFHPDVYLECLKYGIKSEKIKTIDCDALHFNLISESEIGTCLRLRLRPKSGLLPNKNRVEFTVFSSVPCQKPQLFFRPRLRNGTLRNWLRFAATSTTFDSCELLITSFRSTRAFLKYIDNVEPFRKIKYRCLAIEIKTKVTLKLLTNLLANIHVQTLVLFLDPGLTDQNVRGFARAAGRSTYLTSLEMTMNGSIDLYDLTNGGKKKYFQFSVKGNCRLTCRQPISSKNCFNILGIDNLLDNIELISAIEPMTLNCNTRIRDFLSCLNANEHLFLKLTSLRTLVIYMVHDELQNFEMLARGILSLQIVELIIISESTETENLFKCMNDIMNASRINCCLTTIILVDSFFPLLTELTKGLECKHWNKVCLVADFKDLRHLRKDLSNFNVTHDHDTNMECVKMIMRNRIMSWGVALLSITRK